MFWPVFGQVERARENQKSFLPPFFSIVKMDDAERWRMPWPLVEVLRSSIRDRTAIWPFYESIESRPYASGRAAKPEERTKRYGWWLVEDSELETDTTLESRFNVFPFWTCERRFVKNKDGSRKEIASYMRAWPFWSRTTEKGVSRQRVLELNPIRHSEGIDRNWSPFWTFWECEDRPNGRTRHSIFWNAASWHSGGK